MAEKCRATSWRTAFCHPPEKRFSRGAAHSGMFAVRRLAFFAAFWSAVNRGLGPRKLMYFLTAKSTKNSPADAFAYFVPANVRNGRLFAGLQANRPRFLPLLAGPSFHSFGIGPESFAAEREQPTARVPGAGGWQRRPQARADSVLFAEPPQPKRRVFLRRKVLFLLRPLNAGRRLFPRKATCGWFWYFCHQKYRESRDDVAGVLYLFSAKSTDRSLRLVFFAAFWSAKSGAKTDPPTKKAKRRGLTLAPGARLKGGFKGAAQTFIKQASYACAFSRAFVSRLRHRAGIVRRVPRREGCVRDKQEAQKPTIVPKEGGGLGRTKRQQKTRRLPGCKQPAPLKPRRSGGRSQGLGRTKRLKGPAVAGLRRSLPPKDSDTPRARTAECFMYSR